MIAHGHHDELAMRIPAARFEGDTLT
nr:hypothetical protein [Streptomyces longwoodensis]